MPKEREPSKAKKGRKARKTAAPGQEVRSAADIAAERAAAAQQEAVGQEAAPSAEQPEAEEAPSGEPGAEAAPEITVAAVLKGTVELLAVQAWQHMGIQVSPQTGRLGQDLPQARLAIDAASAILEKLQPHLVDNERREYEGLLTNLRINYVQRSNE